MNTAIMPVPRDDAWMKRHEDFVEAARSGAIDVLFIGDSLTDWWREPDKGAPVWRARFAKLKAANFGISADRTQHVLWRLQNGEGKGYAPKVIVLLVGTNNTGMENDGQRQRNTPDEVVEGVLAVVEELRLRFETAKILFFGIFPRAKKDFPQRGEIVSINQSLSRRHDARHVFYLDIGLLFLDHDGEIIEALMPDLLHLSAKGYEVWAEAIHGPLLNLLAPLSESNEDQV